MDPLKLKLLVLILFGLAACSNPDKKKETQNHIQAADTLNTKSEQEDSFVTDTTNFPINILITGMFHHDEILDNASKMKWIGLFKGLNGYYLSNTKVSITPVHDPILDEDESITTGWEVSTAGKDTNIILMQHLPYLQNRKIKPVSLSKTEIYPGERISFNYLGIDYELFATGNKEKENATSDWYIVSNYKLYLRAKIDGKLHKSLLASHKSFDDAMVSLIFAGDLDGDGIVDIILDNSHHYNMTAPTVYFSKPAEKGQVVKSVGSHTSVGC